MKAAREPVPGLAIDTNLLLVVLGHRCLQYEQATTLKREQVLNRIRGRSDFVPVERFEALWHYFRTARRRVVTQHVVAEAYGSRRRLEFPKEVIWRSAIDVLTEFALEELACSIRDLRGAKAYERLLFEIGPTDAGLLHLAEREKLTLVTEDGPLLQWAGTRAVPVLHLRQI